MVVVSGIGIISALGEGVAQNLEGLRREVSPMHLPQHFTTQVKVPVGEVAMSNDELCQKLNIARQPVSRTTLLGIAACREALADAQISDAGDVAFISSTTVGGMDLTPTFYREFMADASKGRLRNVAQHDCASSTDAIAQNCGIGGFRTAISTACSSAANAMMMGARMIEHGLVDTVVCGGIDALCAYTIDGFKSLMILDEAPCRPLDQSRSGLNLGEGAAFVVLQNPKVAKKSYCALAGYANANDAFHQTAVSDDGYGPQMAMRGALEMAKCSPSDVSYINLHGTGTPNNDASETTAIKAIWGSKMPPLSSTKAFTGHTLAAAGAVEAVFSVLAIINNQAWANVNVSNPIEGTSPLRHTANIDVNVVVSNSFGFGGNCSSLVFKRI